MVSPPNSNTVIDGMACTVTRPEDHTDWSDFPNLGVLTLVSALKAVPGVEPIYIDGTVVPWADVLAFVTENGGRILALCVSAITATYEAGLHLVRAAKRCDPEIVSIFGNDHLTALGQVSLLLRSEIDFAFAGNEVIGSFVDLVTCLSHGMSIDPRVFPGLIWRDGAQVRCTPQQAESLWTDVDYDLVDTAFDHTAIYRKNFEKRVRPTFHRMTGRSVAAGVPVEIARGCIKFARNDACSFCSIQFGGMWRNEVSDADEAWSMIGHAYARGYDYLYLTADELPLTFGRLLSGMHAAPPQWWRDLSDAERPVLVGYARADGLSNERNATVLREIGVRQLMVGLDAGTSRSLEAMAKPLATRHERESSYRAEAMFEHNTRALESAHKADLLLKAGFVVGHLGMDRSLLEDNVASMKALIDANTGAIASVDVEVLSPEPGSLDFQCLIDPARASDRASRLGLHVGSPSDRDQIAERWRNSDLIDREEAMADYVTAVMPELTLDDLAAARDDVRSHATAAGITVGE
ncbi:hypothetical protein [Nocardioides sp.]|uniref:B12-binding domain-containing radical SAM protein n=1 Tax=Nocardioides sp. TaxID=35761 RepID=UPI00261A4F30|nr:hypothetical protein [Nocardioides sp.]